MRKNPRTVSRRNLILILLAGLVLALGAAGAAQRDAERNDDATTSRRAGARAAAPGGTEANVVEGALPADRTIRAEVGDDVELHGRQQTPDVARARRARRAHAGRARGSPGTLRFQRAQRGHASRSPTRWPARRPASSVVSEPGADDQDADAAP